MNGKKEKPNARDMYCSYIYIYRIVRHLCEIMSKHVRSNQASERVRKKEANWHLIKILRVRIHKRHLETNRVFRFGSVHNECEYVHCFLLAEREKKTIQPITLNCFVKQQEMMSSSSSRSSIRVANRSHAHATHFE